MIAQSQESSISFRDVSFRYPGKSNLVINKAGLELEPGHIYGLLGENGEGKSTLFRLMAGLNPPTEGCVRTLGYIPFERCPDLMQNLFLVPEEINFPAISPVQYARLFGVFYRTFSNRDFETLLDEFHVDKDAKLSSMSQGQKKKAYISFALACNTPVLLMDEPTNGLDIPSKTKFRKILSGHSGPDRLIIISTHQVLDLNLLIDAVIIMHRHRIVLCETAREILEKVCFSVIDDTVDSGTVIFKEDTVHGILGIIKRSDSQQIQELAQFNIETLFNAVTCDDDHTLLKFLRKA